MSKQDEELVKALQRIGKQKPAILVGKCSNVDTTKALCDVDVDGVTYFDVSLRSVNDGTNKGVLIIPKDGSMVGIGSQFGGVNYSVLMTSEVDEVWLKGVDYDGIVKVGDLVTKLNNLEDTLNSLIAKYNSHIHITTAVNPATGSPGIISPTTS